MRKMANATFPHRYKIDDFWHTLNAQEMAHFMHVLRDDEKKSEFFENF